MLEIYFLLKRCIEILANAILYVRIVSNQLCNDNGPPAQVQRDKTGDAATKFRRNSGVPAGCSICVMRNSSAIS